MGSGLRVALLSSHLPRRCGIATFSHDLITAMESADPSLSISVAAIEEPDLLRRYDEQVRWRIRQGEAGSYRRAAEAINASEVEVVNVQHELGLYGIWRNGAYEDHLRTFLEALRKPVVTTLHTIPPQPAPSLREAVRTAARLSDEIVVMAETAVWRAGGRAGRVGEGARTRGAGDCCRPERGSGPGRRDHVRPRPPERGPYDVHSAVFVMDSLAAATCESSYLELGRPARSWPEGRNPAGAPIYDRAAGRVCDGDRRRPGQRPLRRRGEHHGGPGPPGGPLPVGVGEKLERLSAPFDQRSRRGRRRRWLGTVRSRRHPPWISRNHSTICRRCSTSRPASSSSNLATLAGSPSTSGAARRSSPSTTPSRAGSSSSAPPRHQARGGPHRPGGVRG